VVASGGCVCTQATSKPDNSMAAGFPFIALSGLKQIFFRTNHYRARIDPLW
jgi:hypothetical protein